MTLNSAHPLTAVARVAVLGLATARLTRLVTSDKITEHLVLHHVRKRATFEQDENYSEPFQRPTNLAGYVIEWAECPYCSGLWISAVVLAGAAVAPLLPKPLHSLWKVGIGALAMNYVVAHVSSKID